jgi:hypothetical protein
MGSQDKEVSQVASILGKCVCGKLDSGATLPSLLAFFPGKRKIF